MKIKKQTSVNFKKNIYLLWMLVIFLVLNIYFSIQTVASGSKLASFEKREAEIVKNNKTLTSELVGLTSLTLVESRSSELGFSKPKEIHYIQAPDAVAASLGNNDIQN